MSHATAESNWTSENNVHSRHAVHKLYQQQGERMVISLQHEIPVNLKIFLICECKEAAIQQHNKLILWLNMASDRSV